MSDETGGGLHLPDLKITDFRGIRSLSIQRLGRVSLIAGRNGVGKSTVLEAVRVYAARARPALLEELLYGRDEFASAPEDDDGWPWGDPDYGALFHGRSIDRGRPISIGPAVGHDDVRIRLLAPTDTHLPDRAKQLFKEAPPEGGIQVMQVQHKGEQRFVPSYAARAFSSQWTGVRWNHTRRRLPDSEGWPVMRCNPLGPDMPRNEDLARFWDQVALTGEEQLALRAMNLGGSGIEGVAVVGDDRGRGVGRRVVVRVNGHEGPVPLKSLGDGVTRLFAAGLALANSHGGFLVVDEAENGIHYSIQPAFWRMVLRAAHEYNVQVLATTHSSDCIRGFAQAASETEEAEGILVRLDRDGPDLRATEYTEEDLTTAATQGIEVR